MKKALGFLLVLLLVSVACLALAEEGPAIKADGDLSDWAGLYSLCTGEDKIAILYAFRTDDALYVAFQAPDSTNIGVYDVFLNTDDNPDTGFLSEHGGAWGADFMIETWTGAVYAAGSGTSWDWTDGSYNIQKSASADGTTIEIIAPLSELGSPEKLYIAAWAMNSDWDPIGYAPELGLDMILVPFYDEITGAPITEPITDIALAPAAPLQALAPNAMPGGVVGTLSAKGGDGENYQFSLKIDANNGRDNDLFTLVGDTLHVGDAPLAPGEYKVCVQAQSSIRRESAALLLEVAPQDPATPVTSSIFDGLPGQWFSVAHNALFAPPRLTALKALTDGNRLYFFCEAKDLGDAYAIYLANDAAQGADMTHVWAGAYPTHKITPDGALYAYEAGEWQDTGRKAKLHQTEKGVEGFVVGARLHNLAKAFMVGILADDGDALPDGGAGMLAVTSPVRSYEPKIKADGDPGDWQGENSLAPGTGVVGPLYALRTNDMLYVMTTISGVTDEADDRAFSLNVLIDADGNPTNGYLHEGYPAHFGVDLLVQDWHSLNLEYFVWPATSSEWFSCVSRSTEGIKKGVSQVEEGVYCVEYAIPIALLRDQLPTMSDDLYIAIDRETDMQEGTSVGCAPAAHNPDSGLVLVPKYRTTTGALDVADGTFRDWDGVGNQAKASSDAANMNLHATVSGERLYVLLTAADLTLQNVLTIEADGKAYEVRDGKLDGKPVLLYNAPTSAMFRVDLADIGNPADIRVQVSARDGALNLPAEGMMTVDARCDIAKDIALYHPEETFAFLDNPYQGWMGWASNDPYEPFAQAWQTAYLDIKWAEFEPEKGVYDFDALEEKYHLSVWKERGVRVVLRFVMDDVVDEGDVERMDIPAWLYEELVAENHDGKGAGTFYYEPEDLGGGGFSPNYESPLLKQYHDLAIQKLAERFDDPAICAFVQVGSLGHWAEMHCWPDGTGDFPAPSRVADYMASYDAFERVLKAARKPYPYASEHRWGLYNDMFGDIGETDSFVNYFLEGCTDMPHASSDEVEASRMPDFWKYGYSGGEFAEGNVRKFIADERIVETLRLARASHSSLIGPCSPADLIEGEPDAHAYDDNLLQLHNMMGCRLTIESMTKLEAIQAGQTADIAITWHNRGLSPFYYAWPIELSLKNDAGEVVYAQPLSAALNAFLPGRTTTQEKFAPPSDLAPGAYTLCVAALDPDKGAPAFHLAISGEHADLRCPLYSLTITE